MEARCPAFIGDDEGPLVDFATHDRQKYLWGNVPALDLLNLQQNEGVDFAEDLRLLFAGKTCFVRLNQLLTPLQGHKEHSEVTDGTPRNLRGTLRDCRQ